MNAQFAPPLEQLAFPIKDINERDLPEIWSEPLPLIVHTLTRYSTVEEVASNLPDIEFVGDNLLLNQDAREELAASGQVLRLC